MDIENNFDGYLSSKKGFKPQKNTLDEFRNQGQISTVKYCKEDKINREEFRNASRFNNRSIFENFPDSASRFDYEDDIYTIYKHYNEFKKEYSDPYDINFNSSDYDIFENVIEFDFFSDNKKNINSTSNFLGINGEIDEKVVQGSTGDCWILSALNSLASTESGKQIIKDSVKVNDDNTVTITFGGIGQSYTLTTDKIKRYDTDNNTKDKYSNGDNDVLAFELATQKLWDDINAGKVNINSSNKNITSIENNIGDGGLPSQMIYYLTGVESQDFTNIDTNGQAQDIGFEQIYEILNNAYKNGNYSITFGIYSGKHSSVLTNGNNYTVNVGNGGHAFSITNITADTVTFTNPWDNNAKYTMSYSEFANLGIGYVSYGQLNGEYILSTENNSKLETPFSSNKEDDKNINKKYCKKKFKYYKKT